MLQITQMKIAIPTTGKDLKGTINEHFGRAERFLLIQIPKRSFSVSENPFKDGRGGVGARVASALVKAKVEVVYVDSLGPNAEEVLKESGVKIFRECKGSIKTLLDTLGVCKRE